ncbi:hypothetical protein [Achromobacter xylosoxidans]|uniref:hypothetical protein n=1 Tax=Alcaligenes xylosoxydans xylosoxydans TaxID=85698 RepID=UPI001F131D1A|nr:hypothetical protein [Achromobacter xylosoxidans]
MNPALRGAGKITAVFFSPDGELAAVASAFPLLINPRARAVYGGATLRYRVGLYRRGETAPFATFDALRLPVNDVAFHPTRPAIAIGAGSYDGGYLFEGDLVIWNWADGRSRRPCLHVPEVVRCRYLDDAGQLEAWVRPWDESWDENDDRAAPAADTLLRIRIDDSDAAWRAGEPAALDLDETTAMVDATPPDDGLAVTRLADWLGLPDLGLRGAIWDLAWLDADTLGATHDACLLDRYDRNGKLLSRHEGGGRGSEILPAAAVTVHALAPPRSGRHFPARFPPVRAARRAVGSGARLRRRRIHILGRRRWPPAGPPGPRRQSRARRRRHPAGSGAGPRTAAGRRPLRLLQPLHRHQRRPLPVRAARHPARLARGQVPVHRPP